MDTAIDIIGIGGVGGFLASSLHRGGLPPRIISRGMALQQLQEVGLSTPAAGLPNLYKMIFLYHPTEYK